MAIASFGVLIPVLTGMLFQEPAEIRSVTVPKQERSTYIPAFEKYREAEAALQADALECANRCTEMIDDKSLKETYREARVRVQNTDSSYGDWMLFAPFQLRGRAWMARARAVASRDRKEGAELVRKSIADLEESVRRGMKSSGPYLDQARELAAGFKEAAPAADPRAAEAEKEMHELHLLRDRKGDFEALLKRCDDAASKLKGTRQEGEWLLIREGAVRAIAERFQTQLQETLPPVQTWATLRGLAPADFERRFALPATEDPVLEWNRRCRERLLRLRGATDPARAPLAEFVTLQTELGRMAIEAAGRDGENRSFGPVEALAHDLSRLRLERLLDGADAVPPGERRDRREDGEAVLAGYRDLLGRLDRELGTWPDQGAAFRRQHPILPAHLQGLATAMARFPVDLDRLDDLGKALFDLSDPKGIWGDSPREALRKFEERLPRLDQLEGRPLTRDSRRKLATYHLVAKASRLLLSEERVDEIARREDFREIGRWLRESGGPLPEVMKQVSPKVAAIAAKLGP